jgi:beta-phosphoglucomutase-like phosphatase (HAD superfamily)
MSLEAVVFDLDGVIFDSEPIWDEVREGYIREHGGRYDDEAQRAMMGMSSTEWSRYIHDELGVAVPPERINADVVELMAARYREHLPLIRGAREAVERMACSFPCGVASSSNRGLIARRVCRDRGLARRHPLREGGRHARVRDPQSALPARRGSPRGGGCRTRVDHRAGRRHRSAMIAIAHG